MNNINLRRWVWGSGLVLFAAGFVFTLHSFSVRADIVKRLERKKQTLVLLRGELEEVLKYREGRNLFDKLESGRARPLASLLESSGLAGRIGDVREMKGKVPGGWSHLQSDLVLNEVKVSEVVGFGEVCGNIRPPWRMKRAVFRASSKESGTVQAILTMESLDRVE